MTGSESTPLSVGVPSRTAHLDTFVRDHLPPAADWPLLRFDLLPELARYPARLNCAVELLDRQAVADAARPALRQAGGSVSYGELLDRSQRIAAVLVEDLGLVPGNRVLLRGFNGPLLVAAWLAVQ
ncbi:MAG: AMP-binding protein, partial [Chloroflexota bacterium]|nr:AMP-binding protein [Chloroflexota bacterium]